MVLVFQKIVLFGKQDKQLLIPNLASTKKQYLLHALLLALRHSIKAMTHALVPKYLMTFECKQPLSFPEETELQVKIDATCVLHAPQGEKKNK